jgi:hypothetical protein
VLEEEVGWVIDGGNDDDVEIGATSGLRWRVAVRAPGDRVGCLELAPCRLRDSYQLATSPYDEWGLGSAHVEVAVGFPQ